MGGQQRKKLDTLGKGEEPRIVSDAPKAHQQGDFPKADDTHGASRRRLEGSTFPVRELARVGPHPDQNVRVEEQGLGHQRARNASTRLSDKERSSSTLRPA